MLASLEVSLAAPEFEPLSVGSRAKMFHQQEDMTEAFVTSSKTKYVSSFALLYLLPEIAVGDTTFGNATDGFQLRHIVRCA